MTGDPANYADSEELREEVEVEEEEMIAQGIAISLKDVSQSSYIYQCMHEVNGAHLCKRSCESDLP
jgi:hypothetical protein